MKRFQFSLRTWFILITIATCVFVFGRYVQRRQRLQQTIIEEATLIYKGERRHKKTQTVTSTAMGTFQSSPRPFVTLRDWSAAPWVSQVSKGDAAFSRFDRVQHHNWVPVWMRDILATGELRRLELRQLRESDIDKLGLELIGERNHQLEGLFLTADNPGRINIGSSLKGLERSSKLKELEIFSADADYSQSLPRGLPPNLKHVKLSSCGMTTDDVQILIPCTRLESLSLWGNPCGLSPLLDEGLSPKLKVLALAKTRVTKDDLRALRNCHQLEELNLDGSGIDLRDADGISLPKSLIKLQLDEAVLDASSFRMFAALSNLEALEINESTFQDDDLKGIQLPQSLKTVGARGTNAAIQFAKSLATAEKLQSLNFYGIEIDDQTLFALGEKPELEMLLMNSKGITDASAAWFKPLTKLRRLELIDSSVTDEFFNVAPHIKNVGDLRLQGSGVSGELRTELREIANKRYAEQQEQMNKILGRRPLGGQGKSRVILMEP